MKQNPWFERFTELDQNKNVPLGQNLEGKDHYDDAEGDLEVVHFRGENPEDSFAMRPISVCYRFGRPSCWRAALTGFRAEPSAKSAVEPCSYDDPCLGWLVHRTGGFAGGCES
jgi:hypothetical protein